MGTQISIQLSDRMYSSAKVYAEMHGFDSLQDFIREIVRERLFEREYEKNNLEPALRPEYIEKARKIREEKPIKAGSVEDLRKRHE